VNVDEWLKHKLAQVPGNRELLEATRAAKPKHGPGEPVAGLGHTECQPVQVPALEQNPPHKRRRKARVCVLVEIIRFGRKRFDEDNLIAGGKPLRDAIARSLGTDDDDQRLCWRYDQVIGPGSTGTLIRIERIK